MPKLPTAQRRFLVDAMNRYHNALPGSPAAEYLESQRKLPLTELGAFRLGYVAEPLLGHDAYQGMLAIPYVRWSPSTGASVVSMRFRCVTPGCHHPNHGKYMSSPGEEPRLYNTVAMLGSEDEIGLAEGEIDTITASISGLPTVGVAGVESWKPHFRELFLGYETVYILADGDEPGMRFAKKIAKTLPNAKIISSPSGEDVNSQYQSRGKTALMERLGR